MIYIDPGRLHRIIAIHEKGQAPYFILQLPTIARYFELNHLDRIEN
jgi:hypothetical protein